MIANMLSVAGSDPSGGAGIQADLKTFAALGTYGLSAISAVTVQNTRGVAAVHPLPAELVAAQVDALFDDVAIAAAKTGMLADASVVTAVAEVLARHAMELLVVDPVMVSTSGRELLDVAGRIALAATLVPRALVVTPNLPEAGVLLGSDAPRTRAEMHDAARAIARLGVPFVYLKGGHLDIGDSEVADVICAGDKTIELTHRWCDTRNTHGTGCTLSAAIAALLPRSCTPLDALVEAHHFVVGAIGAADRLSVGGGHGPLHHFHDFHPSVRARG